MSTPFYAAYLTAWLAIGIAGFIGAWCLNALLRRIGGTRSVAGRSLRLSIVAVIFVAFTLPALVPSAPDVYAPAFIVLLFETSFQTAGDPTNAIWMMATLLPLTFVSVFAGCYGVLAAVGKRSKAQKYGP